jgi:hypothetical protein
MSPFSRNTPPRARLSLALLLAAAPAAASTVDVQVGAGAPAGVGSSGAGAGAVTSGGSNIAPLITAPGAQIAAPVLSAPPSVAPSQTGAPSPATVSPAPGAAGVTPAGVSPAGVAPAGATAPVGTNAAGPRSFTPPSRTPASYRAPSRTAATAAAPTPGEGSRGPSAGLELGAAARNVAQARGLDAVDGGMAADHALMRAFDAAGVAPALRASGGVIGRAQDVRAALAQKISIANTASPADAPGLYLDAVDSAKKSLPAAAATAAARVVRSYAARKAALSLGDLAAGAYEAAAAGASSRAERALTAFDKWETLLGRPGEPLLTNRAALQDDVRRVLDDAKSGAEHSAPRVWLTEKGGSFTAVFPGRGVKALPPLAAAFALAPAALSPESALGAAYRAFAAAPGASSGAGLIYRARRALGGSVPSAALAAGRFWLRAAFEALWSRLVAFFRGGTAYALSSPSGRADLRRDAGLASAAGAASADAARRLSSPRLTVGAARAAFVSARAAAESLDGLGESDSRGPIAGLSRAFEAAVSARGLAASDEVPAALEVLLTGPGGLSHWATLAGDAAARRADARALRSLPASGVVVLGAEGDPAARAAREAAKRSPRAAFAADGERLWARGEGPDGTVELSADLRATADGGRATLTVSRGGAALARRLDALGLAVTRDGSALRAELGYEGFSRGAGATAFAAERALAAALGGPEPESAAASLRALSEAARRDPADAKALAERLDGREALIAAPTIGLVGEYEAVGPVAARVGGRTVLVSALRDPDTGLLAYASAARLDGAPLGRSESRALLTAR